MKLSQFKFNLAEEQVALYPHSFTRVFENEDGKEETFEVIGVLISCDNWAIIRDFSFSTCTKSVLCNNTMRKVYFHSFPVLSFMFN